MIGIPHPETFANGAEMADWASRAAEQLADSQQADALGEGFTVTAERLLQAVASSADGRETLVVLVLDVTGGAWTVVRFGMDDTPLSQADVDLFLWPDALLPPRILGFETEAMGQGAMSTFMLADESGAQLGHVRWCFSKASGAVIAQTDPMPAGWLSGLQPQLVDLVMSVTPEGLEAQKGDSFASQEPTFEPPRVDHDEWEVLAEVDQDDSSESDRADSEESR
ncbi:hypothetical protein [uncultured Agrococcus sp.]|uniref:hypothetical protein n=1 Tax=uncultured Agrococcus sp. TaxID=382258 RepID=UPI0025D545DC|nr:hypothetical protein [uncultured Agrococcus sp.]